MNPRYKKVIERNESSVLEFKIQFSVKKLFFK